MMSEMNLRTASSRTESSSTIGWRDPASALPRKGNANRIVGSRGIRGLTVV
jgi:hypothetical protein